jgi:transcriptional regulator GlxA family with amidase domain
MGSDTPLMLVPEQTFADVPAPYAVVVPGGGAATVSAMQDEVLLAYVRAAAKTAAVVGATGNGALVLAAAGLLAGRRAAIHWAYAERLERLGAQSAQERWLHEGRLLTSAGGTAGIDAMLHLVSTLKGERGAKLAQLATEYDPDPPFGGIDGSRLSSVGHEVAEVLGAARDAARAGVRQ